MKKNSLVKASDWHNPDNLPTAGDPPWRFLVQGERIMDTDEVWCGKEWEIAHPDAVGEEPQPIWTWRTRRPLPAPQPGGAGEATHICRHCRCLWRLHHDNTWQALLKPSSCCDNVPMGEQMQELIAGEIRPLPKLLSACPHCGSEKAPSTERNDEYAEEDLPEKDWQFTVVCDVHDGGCGSSCGFHKTPELAVEAWNRRPTPPIALPVRAGEWEYSRYRATLKRNSEFFALVTPNGKDALSEEDAATLTAALNSPRSEGSEDAVDDQWLNAIAKEWLARTGMFWDTRDGETREEGLRANINALFEELFNLPQSDIIKQQFAELQLRGKLINELRAPRSETEGRDKEREAWKAMGELLDALSARDKLHPSDCDLKLWNGLCQRIHDSRKTLTALRAAVAREQEAGERKQIHPDQFDANTL